MYYVFVKGSGVGLSVTPMTTSSLPSVTTTSAGVSARSTDKPGKG